MNTIVCSHKQVYHISLIFILIIDIVAMSFILIIGIAIINIYIVYWKNILKLYKYFESTEFRLFELFSFYISNLNSSHTRAGVSNTRTATSIKLLKVLLKLLFFFVA
jgi:hypothetical protein